MSTPMSKSQNPCPACGAPAVEGSTHCTNCRSPLPTGDQSSAKGGMLLVGLIIIGGLVLFVLKALGIFGD